ncbi:MAG: hypothetical protein J6M07_00350 [Ruminococcus sp.]|nr:hypothetical protein [Ruminococcus sp.]
MYKELAAIYKEFEAEAEALAKRVKARVREVDPENMDVDNVEIGCDDESGYVYLTED